MILTQLPLVSRVLNGLEHNGVSINNECVWKNKNSYKAEYSMGYLKI